MRKYYEEPDFKAVIFESSDVIMTSDEHMDSNDVDAWEPSENGWEQGAEG